jgi:hypothetical protein
VFGGSSAAAALSQTQTTVVITSLATLRLMVGFSLL